jgi:hypothetical protein
MTADEFREIALGLPEVIEHKHMNHPDFRVNGKVFATLGYPDGKWAMVKLSQEEQEVFVSASSDAFAPVKGAWGRQGCTNVRLDASDVAAAKRAIASPWSNIATKPRTKKVR